MSETAETTIAKGIYTIENVHRRNDIFLADGTLVAGSSEANADPPPEASWMIIPLKNGRYIISPAGQQNQYASWPADFSLGSEIMASPTPHQWVVKEARTKETFVISPGRHHLYWGIEDDDEGTAVTLRYPPTGPGNQWRFRPCLTSRTVIPLITDENTDGTRKVDDGRPAIRHILQEHMFCVFSIAFSPDGKQIVSGTPDHMIRVWDVRAGRLALEPITGHSDWVNSVAFSPDGRRIVSGSCDNTVRIWDAQSGTLSLTLNGHTDEVRSVACSPDSKRVVSGSWDATVRVWDVETGSLVLGPLLGHANWVHSVNFSTDGKHILSGSGDGTVRVWDAETGNAIRTLSGPYSVWSANFSPDSKQIVSGDDIGIVRVWDMQTSYSVMFKGHKTSVLSVAFSPDGGRIVSSGMDRQIIVWDAKLGKPLGRLTGHTNWVRSVAFSPDGKWIVSCSHDTTVRIWEADRLDAMPGIE